MFSLWFRWVLLLYLLCTITQPLRMKINWKLIVQRGYKIRNSEINLMLSLSLCLPPLVIIYTQLKSKFAFKIDDNHKSYVCLAILCANKLHVNTLIYWNWTKILEICWLNKNPKCDLPLFKIVAKLHLEGAAASAHSPSLSFFFFTFLFLCCFLFFFFCFVSGQHESLVIWELPAVLCFHAPHLHVVWWLFFKPSD